MPAVVIGHQRDRDVADLRFPGQLWLPAGWSFRSRPCPSCGRALDSALVEKAGTFHANVGASLFGRDAGLAGTRGGPVRADPGRRDLRRQCAPPGRRRKRSKSGPGSGPETGPAKRCPAGAMFLLQRSDGADRQDALDAQQLHRINVGAKIELRRHDRCPRPWRARKATLLPERDPRIRSSEGDAEGSIDLYFASRSVKPGMSYNPLPPMIPIFDLFHRFWPLDPLSH